MSYIIGFFIGVIFMLALNWFAPWWYRAQIREMDAALRKANWQHRIRQRPRI